MMNFTSILVVYIWHFLIGVAISMPKPDDHIRDVVLTPKNQLKTHTHVPIRTSTRTEQLSDQEREERINRAMARMMQFITFMGHVDNYLTDKVKTLTRTLNQAVLSGDEEEPQEQYYDRRRQANPRILTTTSS